MPHNWFMDTIPLNFTENVQGFFFFFKKLMLINRTLLVRQMLSLFSRTNPAYIEISLTEIYASLHLYTKKFNGTP